MRVLGFFICSIVVCVMSPHAVLAVLSDDPFVSQWAFEKTNIYQAWGIETGSRDVVVAVIDNGFDYLHPDIRGNVWKNTDEVPDNRRDDDNNGYVDDVWGWNFIPEDVDGDGDISAIEQKGNNDPRPNATGENSDDPRSALHHGTVVAGLIGATGNNGLYGSGVAWRVRLMNVKVASNAGSGVLSDLPQAIVYAVDNGADIINLSLVGYYYPDYLTESLQYAKKHGVLVVAASGNNSLDLGVTPAYPLCADGEVGEQLVLGVTAVRSDRRLAGFANSGDCIDIAAPGVGVSSTMRFSPTNGFIEGYGGNWNGTSFAAPLVSGAAALIKAVRPELSGAEVRDILLSTVSKTPTTDEVGYKKLFGYGFLDVAAAVQKASSAKQDVEGGVFTVVDSLGQVYTHQYDGFVLVASVARLKHVDDIATYTSPNGTQYAVTKRVGNRVVVSVFSSDWELQQRFTKTLPVAQRVVLADIDYDGVSDIVLSPAESGDTVLARVYTQSGRLMQTILPQAGTLRSGVSVVVQRVNDKNELHFWYMSDDSGYIDTRNETGGWTQVRTVDTPTFHTELRASRVSGTVYFSTISDTESGHTVINTYDVNGQQIRKRTLFGGWISPTIVTHDGVGYLTLVSRRSGLMRAYTYPTLSRDVGAVFSNTANTPGAIEHTLFVSDNEM